MAVKAVAEIAPNAGGIELDWQGAFSLFDGHDPEVLMVSALNGAGRVICIDRYVLLSPNSTDAAAIAAQERRLLRTRLNSRERVAEVRVRAVWYETAAGGNALPRIEY